MRQRPERVPGHVPQRVAAEQQRAQRGQPRQRERLQRRQPVVLRRPAAQRLVITLKRDRGRKPLPAANIPRGRGIAAAASATPSSRRPCSPLAPRCRCRQTDLRRVYRAGRTAREHTAGWVAPRQLRRLTR